MPLSFYESTVPVFERSLSAFLGILDRAEEHANARKFDSAKYLALRLSPDMFPFSAQVQSFCDHAKNGSLRLAGVDPPRFEDSEKSLDELRARIRRTIELVQSIDAKAMEGAERREVVFRTGPNTMKMPGASYLLHFVTPNFYFHLTTAYDILRSAGVEIGKRDFLGAVPGIARA